MKQWPLTIIKYLAGFMILSTVHCTVVAMVLARDRGTFVYSLVYLPVIILLSETQKRTKYFWQYALCAGAAVIFVHLVGRSIFERKLSVILTLIAVAFYFYARARKAECILDTPETYFLLLYVAVYFLERQFPSRLLEHYAVIGAGFYLLLCMYKTNMNEIHEVFDLNGNLERFPEKRLLKNNLLMMGIQTVFVISGMIAAMFVGIDGIVDTFRDIVAKIVRWILKLLESDVKPEGAEVLDGKKELIFIEAKETSAFMEFLLKLLDILSTLVIIALIVYAIYRVLRKLYQLYLDFDKNASENGDQIEKIYTVQTKEEKKRLRKKRTENLFWDRTPDARIRKSYKKRVLRDLNKIPKPSMTPEEIERGIVMDDDKKMIFHSLYEKARYGNEKCTAEDVEKFMEI